MAPDEISTLQQKVAVLESERRSDGERMDRMEQSIAEGFRDMKAALTPIGSQLTELNGWMNRSKGWAAAALLLAGLLGALVKTALATVKP